MQKFKHIAVNQEVYKKLKYLGTAGDSFNDVLIQILQDIEKRRECSKQLSMSNYRVGTRE